MRKLKHTLVDGFIASSPKGQSVVVHSIQSEPTDVLSEVPQRSVLRSLF